MPYIKPLKPGDTRPLQRYILIDQNCLRDKSLVKAQVVACQKQRLKILFPDVALAEIFKGNRWESTAKASFRNLAQWNKKVVMARLVGDLITEELRSGNWGNDFTNRIDSPRFRDLLRDFGKGSGPTVSEGRRRIEHTHRLAEKQVLNDDFNRGTLKLFQEWWRGELTLEGCRKLRDKKARAEKIPLLLGDTRVETQIIEPELRKMAAMVRYESNHATDLAKAPSVGAHYFLAMAGLALRWLVDHGLEGAKPQRLAGDLIDAEYALYGSLSHRLISKDKGMLELHGWVRSAAEVRWARQ